MPPGSRYLPTYLRTLSSHHHRPTYLPTRSGRLRGPAYLPTYLKAQGSSLFPLSAVDSQSLYALRMVWARAARENFKEIDVLAPQIPKIFSETYLPTYLPGAAAGRATYLPTIRPR